MTERTFDFDTPKEEDAPDHRPDRRLAIRSEADHGMVARVEIVCPHHTNSRQRFDQSCEMCAANLHNGVSVTLVNMFAPGRFDPAGIHTEISRRFDGTEVASPEVRPRVAVTYLPTVDGPRADIQPVALGNTIPDVPLFVDPAHDFNAPLESTYMAAWRGIAAHWRDVIEST